MSNVDVRLVCVQFCYISQASGVMAGAGDGNSNFSLLGNFFLVRKFSSKKTKFEA